MQLNINSKFQSLVPKLSEEERKQLEENLINEGCRDPIVIWDNTILDGHNRYEICQEYEIPFNTTPAPEDIKTEEDAEDWIDRNQLGRRNLTPDDFKLILGRRYNRMKATHGGDRKSNYNVSELWAIDQERQKSSRQNDDLKTSEKLAQEHGVSKRTVERAGKFAEAVEEAKKEHPGKEEKEIYEAAKKESKPKRTPPPKSEEDSDALFNLKRWWRQTTKKDKLKFLSWIKEK